MPFTFKVEDVKSAGPKSYGKNHSRMFEPQQGQSLEEAWKQHGIIEAMSDAPKNVVETFTKQNLLVKSVHAAFYGHHPLILSPDVIWLTIAQGLANHIDQNAEELRKKFVNHEGKKEIEIERPTFVKGSKNNDWPGVFPEFSEKIEANTVEGTVKLIESDFSTTGPVEKIVSHITLMDAVQHYFSYSMCCGCGFPEITLTGEPDDWKKIRSKAALLKQYGLEWWLKALLPALDQFVLASEGKPDLNFWKSLCNINVGTSFRVYEPVTGWIQAFFLYLNAAGYGFDDFDRFAEAKDGVAKKQLQKNECLEHYMESFQQKVGIKEFEADKNKPRDREEFRFADPPSGTKRGIKLELFPPALSSAPFVYKDTVTNKKHSMAFMGGLTTLVQHPSGAIEAKIGWAVIDSGKWEPIKFYKETLV
eukprot:TCONS_00006290-protein